MKPIKFTFLEKKNKKSIYVLCTIQEKIFKFFPEIIKNEYGNMK